MENNKQRQYLLKLPMIINRSSKFKKLEFERGLDASGTSTSPYRRTIDRMPTGRS